MYSMNFDDLVAKKVIHLWGKRLREEGLDVLIKVLRKSKVLEELGLGNNQLTLADGKFTDALANNDTLTYLNLYGNKLGAKGAERLADALKVNKTLKKLYLDGNKIGDEGAKHIADALMDNETLDDISLIGNKIGDDGANSLANCFIVNQSIREVNLEDNNISDIGAQKLIEALKRNDGIKYFYIPGNVFSGHVKAEINTLMKDPERKMPPLIKRLREENTTLKAALASAEAKLKSIQDEKEAMGTSLNDTRIVKVKQEADATTNIYNADTPEKKKQKTEKA